MYALYNIALCPTMYTGCVVYTSSPQHLWGCFLLLSGFLFLKYNALFFAFSLCVCLGSTFSEIRVVIGFLKITKWVHRCGQQQGGEGACVCVCSPLLNWSCTLRGGSAVGGAGINKMRLDMSLDQWRGGGNIKLWTVTVSFEVWTELSWESDPSWEPLWTYDAPLCSGSIEILKDRKGWEGAGLSALTLKYLNCISKFYGWHSFFWPDSRLSRLIRVAFNTGIIWTPASRIVIPRKAAPAPDQYLCLHPGGERGGGHWQCHGESRGHCTFLWPAPGAGE